jgi:hypothetical protein
MKRRHPLLSLIRHRARRRSGLAYCASILSLFNVLHADDLAARDLTVLADLVKPAYAAMQFAVVCGRQVSQFAQPRGMRGSAIEYAEHVKDEAIASLTYGDAVTVLRAAADAARSTARQELRKLVSTDPDVEATQLTAWCGGYARKFILNFMTQHDHLHQAFLLEVERAKHW